MNNCLAELSRLIPAGYLKRGRGRIEKTEIIEMTIKYLRHLQENGSAPMGKFCFLWPKTSQTDPRWYNKQHHNKSSEQMEHWRDNTYYWLSLCKISSMYESELTNIKLSKGRGTKSVLCFSRPTDFCWQATAFPRNPIQTMTTPASAAQQALPPAPQKTSASQ